MPARLTGTKARYQRQLDTAVKRARFSLFLLTLTTSNRRKKMQVILLETIPHVGQLGGRRQS